LAPTRDLVAELNTRARHDRLDRSVRPATSPCDTERGFTSRSDTRVVVDLADGTQASTGDVILTRRNDRRLRSGPTDWVKNGDRWVVRNVHHDGAMSARRL